MPQELHVVRCYSCEAFQVDIIKKVPKWTCKMCGEKQSLKKVYSKGTGKECREFVQNLNEQRLSLQSRSCNENSEIPNKQYEVLNDTTEQSICLEGSKWSEYIQVDSINDDIEDRIIKKPKLNTSTVSFCDISNKWHESANKTSTSNYTDSVKDDDPYCTIRGSNNSYQDNKFVYNSNVDNIEISNQSISTTTNRHCSKSIRSRHGDINTPDIKVEKLDQGINCDNEPSKWHQFLNIESHVIKDESDDQYHIIQSTPPMPMEGNRSCDYKENITTRSSLRNNDPPSRAYNNRFEGDIDLDMALQF